MGQTERKAAISYFLRSKGVTPLPDWLSCDAFPSHEAATKLLFLVLHQSEKEWIMPPHEWSMAKSQFAVLFGERFTAAMN